MRKRKSDTNERIRIPRVMGFFWVKQLQFEGPLYSFLVPPAKTFFALSNIFSEFFRRRRRRRRRCRRRRSRRSRRRRRR